MQSDEMRNAQIASGITLDPDLVETFVRKAAVKDRTLDDLIVTTRSTRGLETLPAIRRNSQNAKSNLNGLEAAMETLIPSSEQMKERRILSGFRQKAGVDPSPELISVMMNYLRENPGTPEMYGELFADAQNDFLNESHGMFRLTLHQWRSRMAMLASRVHNNNLANLPELLRHLARQLVAEEEARKLTLLEQKSLIPTEAATHEARTSLIKEEGMSGGVVQKAQSVTTGQMGRHAMWIVGPDFAAQLWITDDFVTYVQMHERPDDAKNPLAPLGRPIAIQALTHDADFIQQFKLTRKGPAKSDEETSGATVLIRSALVEDTAESVALSG